MPCINKEARNRNIISKKFPIHTRKLRSIKITRLLHNSIAMQKQSTLYKDEKTIVV